MRQASHSFLIEALTFMAEHWGATGSSIPIEDAHRWSKHEMHDTDFRLAALAIALEI